jgi:hypothetical protein
MSPRDLTKMNIVLCKTLDRLWANERTVFHILYPLIVVMCYAYIILRISRNRIGSKQRWKGITLRMVQFVS